MENSESKCTTCSGCGQRIDPDWCYCGQHMDKHTEGDNHTPVPMGCTCYENNEPIPWEEDK